MVSVRVHVTEGTECLVYPGFGSMKYSLVRMYDDNNLYEGKDNHRAIMMRSLDQYRATAANWYAWGADGGSSFNMYMWPPEQERFFFSLLRECLDNNVISESIVREEMASNHVRHDALAIIEQLTAKAA